MLYLVNNAGIGCFGVLEHQRADTISNVYETNVYGVIHAIRAVLPSMKKQKSGHIITVSSVAGLRGVPMNAVYSSSKFAVFGLSESLAPELAQFNIKSVNDLLFGLFVFCLAIFLDLF